MRVLAVVLCLATWPCQAFGAIYDIASDWSDVANPNGAWAYREGSNALPAVADWDAGHFSSPQPAWASGPGLTPLWFKSIGAETFPNDWQAGDVVVHSSFETNVIWTSPESAPATIRGGVWMGREIDRSNHWALYKNDALLTEGDIASGDPYSRSAPFALAAGSGGVDAVTNVPVTEGDVIRLAITKLPYPDGDFVGVDLRIQTCGGQDAAGALEFDSLDYVAHESEGSALVTVKRLCTAGSVTVDFATPSGGTATEELDYRSTEGTLTLSDGQSSVSFPVCILPDALEEDDETVFLTLSNPTGGATLGTVSSATLNIVDADNSWALAGTSVLKVSATGTYRGYRVSCRLRCRYEFEASLFLEPDGSYRVPSGELSCPLGGSVTLPDEVGAAVPGRRGRLDLEPENVDELKDAFAECVGVDAVVRDYGTWVQLDEDGVHLEGEQHLKARAKRGPGVPFPAAVRVQAKFAGTLVRSGEPIETWPPTRRQARFPVCGPGLEPKCSLD